MRLSCHAAAVRHVTGARRTATISAAAARVADATHAGTPMPSR